MARYLRARYVRHRHFNRLRHSSTFRQFLAEQAERLEIDEDEIFDLMKIYGFTADQIRASSEDPTPRAPSNTVAPVLSGTPTVGQTLSVTNGTWAGNPTPTYTRAWRRDGTAISGATGTTYVLVEADVGAQITVSVTGTNATGNATANSNSLGPVVAAE